MVSTGLLGLLVGYLVVLMYVQGEYLFAIMTLILSLLACIFLQIVKPTPGAIVYPASPAWGCLLFPLEKYHRHRLFTNY